jgi:hypothetical protein
MIINARISDVLISDRNSTIKGRSCIVRKENGEVLYVNITIDELKNNINFKSVLTNKFYYVNVYYRSNGKVVRKLKCLNVDTKLNFKERLKGVINRFYYIMMLSTFRINFIDYCSEKQCFKFYYSEDKFIIF